LPQQGFLVVKLIIWITYFVIYPIYALAHCSGPGTDVRLDVGRLQQMNINKLEAFATGYCFLVTESKHWPEPLRDFNALTIS